MTTSKDVVFISHANPDDNEFTRWLSLKLASLGYHVWSDVTRLLGGEDFWNDIERAIRQNTVKFLYVLSKASNQREGSLMELKVAHDVRKKEKPHDFIIPLHVDDLPSNEISIQLANLIARRFFEELGDRAQPRLWRFLGCEVFAIQNDASVVGCTIGCNGW